MTFSQEIKQEVVNQSMSKEQFLCFLKGIFYSIGTLKGDALLIKISNERILKYVIYGLNKHGETSNVIEDKDQLIAKKEFIDNINFEVFPWVFFAGIFTVSGSTNAPDSSMYHCEIKLKNKNYIELITFLEKNNLSPAHYARGKFQVLYWKKTEYISDFLRLIGAWNAVMKFERFRIERDFNNNLNRISNFEFFNQERISNASALILDAIEYIEAEGLLDQFTKNQIAFMELKKKLPYEPLSTLVWKLEEQGIKISKSGLNHWVRKIKKFSIYNN